ncbi:pentatricopeptide repeat-containing protein [Sesbania bispinosa]|nr:pentatricopeptide repeat-containing protein [Sesbania bispinosa]
METRQQAHVEASESRLSSVETRVQDLLQAFGTLQDTMVKEQHEQSEFRALFGNFLKDHGRRPTGEGDEGEISSSNNNVAQILAKWVELPPFDGIDPRGWLTKAETYL